MKILLVNYHYFIHGGPDRYFFNAVELLQGLGHEVVPFCFDYEETLETPYRKYFPEPITRRGPCLLSNQRLSTGDKLKAVVRMFHNPQVTRLFRQVLKDESPDIVYSIYLSSSMLPNILHIARHEFNIPVLYRLSDFHMTCGSYLLAHDGRVCTECVDHPMSLVRHRCMQGSLSASLLRYLQMQYIQRRNWLDSVNLFLCPSRFMARHLIDCVGIAPERVRHLPTFSQDIYQPSAPLNDSNYILFFGKLIPEKGVETLLQAYNRIDLNRINTALKLVGSVTDEYRQLLFSILDEPHRRRLQIAGPMKGDALWESVRCAKFIVQPAQWFENMPNTILESMSAGKVVVASNIGSLPELIEHGVNGLLVEPEDVPGLAAAMERLAVDAEGRRDMGAAARRRYLASHTSQLHKERLNDILSQLPLKAKRHKTTGTA